MTPRERLARNPFYLLGLAPGATRAQLEEQGQKLLGMLELDLDGAASYATPVGPETRSADDVRAALAELRDPERRRQHEPWATLPTLATAPAPADEVGWPAAFAALGMGRRRGEAPR
jgi:hypothetical protein